MKDLYQQAAVDEIKSRLQRLTPEHERRWGKMTAAQAVAHCAASLEIATGDLNPPRVPIGWVLGWIIKPVAFRDGEPFRKNSPTMKELIVTDDRDLEVEKRRLCERIDRFSAIGPTGCTKRPHSFFGNLTPEEWSFWMYKHLDHHLQQFGV